MAEINLIRNTKTISKTSGMVHHNLTDWNRLLIGVEFCFQVETYIAQLTGVSLSTKMDWGY